jgi:hypothetical protein
MHRTKKVVAYVLVAFVIFYLFTRPAQAATAVNGVFSGILHGANQLAVFATNIAT